MKANPKIILYRIWNKILYKHKCNSCNENHFINWDSLDEITTLLCSSCKANTEDIHNDELVEFNSWYDIIWAESWLAMTTKRQQRYNVTKKITKQLIEIYWTQCQYCYKDCLIDDSLTIDHIYPVSAWWTNHFSNLVIACSKCNARLSNKIFNSLVEKQEYIARTT